MVNTYRILSPLIALSLLIAACGTSTPQPTATLPPPAVIFLTPTPIPPTPTLSPEQQQKIIVENKIKRHLTVLGMTMCENCTIKNLSDNFTEALVQKVVDKDGKEQEIILSAVGTDGKEIPYKLWKMQAQGIAGMVVDGAKVVDGKGLTSYTWDVLKQEWAADRKYLIDSFEVSSDHADYFWFNQHLSSSIINLDGKTEEFLFGQMNCFPVSRRFDVQEKKGVEILFVDCVLQTPSGEKRAVTLAFQTLPFWENPFLAYIGTFSNIKIKEEVYQLIDNAIKSKKQIGVDIIVGHKPSFVQKAVCGPECASMFYASEQTNEDLLGFFLSAGGKGEKIEIFSVRGIYKTIQQKADFSRDARILESILRGEGGWFSSK